MDSLKLGNETLILRGAILKVSVVFLVREQ
jgi:hypothetical protein